MWNVIFTTLAKLRKKIKAAFNWDECHKESMGYRCQHSVHNGIRECDGRLVR